VAPTVSPRPVQCRSGEPNDRELFGRVYRQARCATSCPEPDEWFPLTADVGRAREQAARAIAICAGCPVRADCLELSLRTLSASARTECGAAWSPRNAGSCGAAGWQECSVAEDGAEQLPGRFLTPVTEARDL
jgi:Transcription factor WhiB